MMKPYPLLSVLSIRDIELAEAAIRVGARAIVIKSHQGFTVNRAWLCNEHIKQLLGDVVLNKVVRELREIFKIIKDYDAVLGTAYVSPEEAFVVIEAARNAGVNKIVLTHPE